MTEQEIAHEYLKNVGYWSRIELEDITEKAVFFSAFDVEGDEVSLWVEIDDDEWVVHEYYEGGSWTTVDTP